MVDSRAEPRNFAMLYSFKHHTIIFKDALIILKLYMLNVQLLVQTHTCTCIARVSFEGILNRYSSILSVAYISNITPLVLMFTMASQHS